MPGAFFDTESVDHSDLDLLSHHACKLSRFMGKTTYPLNRKTYLDSYLTTCTHVYVRVDAVRSPLTRPCVGPYRVMHHSDKFFTLQFPDKFDTVSIDRL